MIDRKDMGKRLRSIRKAHKLTLKQLSARSGVALSTLSKMELAHVSISYEKFAAVAKALGVNISRLFDPNPPEPAAPAPTFVKSSIAPAPGYVSDHYDYRMFAVDFPAKQMTPLHGRILARAIGEFPDYIRHPGQEFVLVLSGSLRICFETGESVRLSRAETAYFDSGVGHVYLSLSKADARVLIVMTAA
jgi:transcriptional regulator with XRE-family HTH domain